ncbi:unnamed protein product, partial [Brassica rapa subsp. trilocularis]
TLFLPNSKVHCNVLFIHSFPLPCMSRSQSCVRHSTGPSKCQKQA